MNTKTINYLLVIAFLAATSCLWEPETFEHDNGMSIAIKLSIPETTRSEGAIENTIQTLDVLAFKVEGGRETFLYSAEASKTATPNTFYAKLRKSNFQQRFVLIANAREKIETISNSWAGIEKEAMLKNLTLETNGKRWIANTHIPMWGETEAKTVTDETSTINAKMLRMVAKIDVQLSPALDDFKLKSVHVYNASASGRIAPKPNTKEIEYIGSEMLAIKASMPETVKKVTQLYDQPSDFDEIDVSMRGAIYLFESEADHTDFLKETCIVVGVENQNWGLTYYRLDFISATDSSYLDILRNQRYHCNITAISGQGFLTPDEAFRTRQYHMKADVFEWEEGMSCGDILFDTQYFLSVNQSVFHFDAFARNESGSDNRLSIDTNFPAGWSYSVWADIDGTESLTDNWLNTTLENSKDLRLTTTANTNGVREAYIRIKAGRLMYMVKVVQDKMTEGTTLVSVTPDFLLLPHAIQAYDYQTVYVHCVDYNGADDPNQEWKIGTVDPWLRLSLNPNGSDAKRIVSGQGTTTVYLVAENNAAVASRITTIYLGDSESNTEAVVMQSGNSDHIIGAGDLPYLPDGYATYIGAFWRAEETGERLINIKMGENTAYYGNWSASVAWYDTNWHLESGDGIIFSTENSPDPNIFKNNPGNAENYKLTGNTTIVTGTVDGANKDVFFRIGLNRKFTDFHETENPARYAVILLSYANNTRHQKIFIRQGEGADFLMSKYDPINLPDYFSPNRPYAKRFAVFNNTGGASLNSAVPPYNGFFTHFPTQAGAFWSFIDGKRIADAPHLARGPYKGLSATGAWDKLRDKNETSPPGFRRPTDGPTDIGTDGNTLASSEIRQSLFWKPPIQGEELHTDFEYSNIENSVWGYYADGFFDRRPIVDAPNAPRQQSYYFVEQAKNCAVSTGDRNIAYDGRLFFNPEKNSSHYNASLFLPAAGARDDEKDILFAGQEANYMTATRWYATGQKYGPWILKTTATTATIIHYPTNKHLDENTLKPVRAVRDE